jgi:putative membrane protein
MRARSFEPSVVLGLVIVAAIYVAGLCELARRGRPWRTVTHRHAVSFMLGLLAVLLALLSPIDTFAGRLFALHMLQHLLLLMVAPPLLLLGNPLPALLVGAPRGLVRRVARVHARTPGCMG